MAAPTTDPAPDLHPPRSPFANKWWIIAAVVVGLIAALLLYLLVSPPYQGPRLDTSSPSVAVARGGPTSACGLPSGDQTPPQVTPAGTHWRLIGTMAAPYDPASVGPAQDREHTVQVPTASGMAPVEVSVHVPLCYAPTPLGALYAITNFVATSSTPELQRGAADLLCAPGPGLDAARANLAIQPSSRSTGVQVVAFRFTGYVPAVSATVDLVIRNASGTLVHFDVAAVFVDGDWRVQLPVTGSPYDSAAVLPTTAGYASWSGA